MVGCFPSELIVGSGVKVVKIIRYFEVDNIEKWDIGQFLTISMTVKHQNEQHNADRCY